MPRLTTANAILIPLVEITKGKRRRWRERASNDTPGVPTPLKVTRGARNDRRKRENRSLSNKKSIRTADWVQKRRKIGREVSYRRLADNPSAGPRSAATPRRRKR